MAKAFDSDELALVEKALKCGVTRCVEWHPAEADRICREIELHNLTLDGIQQAVIKYVQAGGKVRQVKETRSNRQHRTYYYKVIVPMPDVFKKGLFVEMELLDPDPDLPEVMLVNAHEQN